MRGDSRIWAVMAAGPLECGVLGGGTPRLGGQDPSLAGRWVGEALELAGSGW